MPVCHETIDNSAQSKVNIVRFYKQSEIWIISMVYSERPRGAGFRSVYHAERWCENPAKALTRAGLSQHLECGIHRSESSPDLSTILRAGSGELKAWAVS